MIGDEPITFVVPVNDESILKANFLASPLFSSDEPAEILLQRGFSSAAMAYNSAIDQASHDLIVFAHQDVFFPASWLRDVRRALCHLKAKDSKWGVLGCYGMTKESGAVGFLYSNGVGLIGRKLQEPTEVQTLDEIVLIVRRSSQLRFNSSLPNFHLYGTDLCLQAAEMGRKCYALPAFCIHNTRYASVLPEEFYESYAVVKKLWRAKLPIRTSCINITRLNLDLYVRKLRGLQFKFGLRTDRYQKERLNDPSELYQHLVQHHLTRGAPMQTLPDEDRAR